MQRESMEFDVLVVGGGPLAWLRRSASSSWRNEAGQEVSVCVIEKGPRSAPISFPAR